MVGEFNASVPRVNVCIEALVVHVPQYPDWLLALGLALEDGVLGDEGSLGTLLDLERRRGCKEKSSLRNMKVDKNHKKSHLGPRSWPQPRCLRFRLRPCTGSIPRATSGCS